MWVPFYTDFFIGASGSGREKKKKKKEKGQFDNLSPFFFAE